VLHVTVPGSPPVNVRARPVSSSTVVVQWEEPLQPNGVIKVCVIMYFIAVLTVSLSTRCVLSSIGGDIAVI